MIKNKTHFIFHGQIKVEITFCWRSRVIQIDFYVPVKCILPLDPLFVPQIPPATFICPPHLKSESKRLMHKINMSFAHKQVPYFQCQIQCQNVGSARDLLRATPHKQNVEFSCTREKKMRWRWLLGEKCINELDNFNIQQDILVPRKEIKIVWQPTVQKSIARANLRREKITTY